MALYKMDEILKDAKSKNYAVGAYNTLNLEMVRGVIKAAESEKSPVILSHAEVHGRITPLETIAPIMLEAARRAKVPVSILLDHGESFSEIVKAMKLGINAVMYDGSNLEYEQNEENTREIVKIAKAMGVSVEAELGHVTRPKSASTEGEEEDSLIYDTTLHTDPDRARVFAENTGIDALAIAFGTSHGIYLDTPRLDFKRLQSIADLVEIPLVMHGGSGLSENDFKKAIDNGICKINYYTGLALKAKSAIIEAARENGANMHYHKMLELTIESICTETTQTMRIFGSSGKA